MVFIYFLRSTFAFAAFVVMVIFFDNFKVMVLNMVLCLVLASFLGMVWSGLSTQS